MNNLVLQKATENDWEIVATLEKKAASEFYHALTDEQEIKEYIKDSKVFFLVGDSEIIGTVSYEEKENNSIYFNGLIILNEYRRKGIASWAIKNILENINDKKIVTLVVHPKNTPAILLYLKAGFVIEEWKDNYFGDGEPRLLLVRN